MPQATDEIRELFFERDNKGNVIGDGIARAESIIEEAGGSVSANGTIIYDGPDEDAWNAINYLCNEWDYALI